MPLRAVVFDLFDTLVDLRFEDLPRMEHAGRRLPASLREMHAAAAEHRLLDFDEFLKELHAVDTRMRAVQVEEGREISTQQRFEELVQNLGIEDPQLPAVLTDVHMGTLRSTVSVPDHHRGLLGQLGARVSVGLCSNFTHSATALAVVEEAGFREHFDVIAISDAVGWRKPREEIFRVVLETLDVAPEEALHVGDSLRADVAGAAAVGMRTAWVTRRVTDPDKLRAEHEGPAPDHELRDLAELESLIEGEEFR